MVRNYKRKGTRSGDIDEEAMKSATKEVLNKTLSIRKSADKFGVKPSTLESRIKNVHKKTSGDNNIAERSFGSKYTVNQVFSIAEELLLNKYITECSRMHYGLTLENLKRLAYEYALANKLNFPPSWNRNKMAGKDWLEGYRKCNPNLSLRKPENTSAARSYGFNKAAVNDFYRNLENILVKYKFTGDRIFNFDESGISTVLNTPKVLAEKTEKQIGQLVSAERGELVTFGGIISANGNTIAPLFVFPRVHFKDRFMDGAPEGSLGVSSKSGWINSNIFVEVLKHIQKHTLCSKANPILLLADNHESHISIDAVNYARENGIVYLSFPPHTTHRLQPLDVGVFGPFKSKLKIAFNDWHLNNIGKTLNIYNIPRLAKIAYFQTFTGKNITSAFEKTGIWPFNKLIFSDDDFAPVQVYQSCSIADLQENIVPTIPEDTDASIDTQPISSPPLPYSPHQPQNCDIHTASTSKGPVSPEMVRPYPKVNKNMSTKSKKGKQLGKSRIYTDTPEKNSLEEIEEAKDIKKKEQEQKKKTREIKHVLSLLSETNKTANPKRKKKTIIETDSESDTEMSIRESSTSPIDEVVFEESDIEIETPVLAESITEGTFLLIKFEKNQSVLYYVRQVATKYCSTEYKVSFLRKKDGSWKFVFPNIKDEGTIYFSDVVSILPQPKSASTARTSSIFSFAKDLSAYNVQ